MVTNINEKQYDQEVLNSKGLVLVDFYSETCGPCKKTCTYFGGAF